MKGRCLNRLTMEPSSHAFRRFLFRIYFLLRKNSPSRARTYNNSVNSRVLYHWAIEESIKRISKSVKYTQTNKFYVLYRRICSKFFIYSEGLSLHLQNRTSNLLIFSFKTSQTFRWSSPRPISKCLLNTLLCLHLIPIYLVVFKGSYWFLREISSWGGLHA